MIVTDPRFLDLTPEQIQVDYWAHYYTKNPSNESFESEGFDEEVARLEANPDEWEDI